MREAEERVIFRNAVDRRLSGLQENPFLAQRIMNAEKGEIKVKKKLTMSMALVIVLLLIAVTALAVALLSPKEIVEQVAVPVAQNNDHENYTYEELAELIQTLNENGITLDEGSRMMKAFQSGHGYWEADTINEICRAAFGEDTWTPEQRYWYGEIMVAIGVWDHNDYFLPKEDELQEKEARILAVQILKNTYHVDLPAESNDSWTVIPGLGEDIETGGIPSWFVTFIPKSDDYELQGYEIIFDLHGENAKPDRMVVINLKSEEAAAKVPDEVKARFGKEKQAVSEYGEVMHFWPDEVKVEIYSRRYGLPYAIPEPEEYAAALKDAERFIAEEYGADALEKLGDYKVGYLFQKLDDEENIETKATQLMWDIMFTTDPEFLSDGYRVQFQRVIDHETGEEKIIDVIVEHANLGVG